MTRLDVREAIEATVEPLTDIARTTVWHRIEAAIATPAPPRRRGPRAAAIGLGIAAAAALVLVAGLGWLRGGAPASGAVKVDHTTLVIEAGSRAHHRWDGGELTLYGPATIELTRAIGHTRLVVTEGTILAHRDAGGPALLVETPTSTTWATDATFAVHVDGHATELASGALPARLMIERHQRELTPPPAADPVPPPGTIDVPAPVDAATPPHRPARSRPEAPAVTPGVRDEVVPPPEQPPDGEVAPPPAPTLDDVYLRAEAALRAGDPATAERLLAQIIAAEPDGRLAAAATYDLALIAFRRDDLARALRLVDALIAAGSDPNLTRPARELRCRILRARGEACRSAD